MRDTLKYIKRKKKRIVMSLHIKGTVIFTRAKGRGVEGREKKTLLSQDFGDPPSLVLPTVTTLTRTTESRTQPRVRSTPPRPPTPQLPYGRVPHSHTGVSPVSLGFVPFLPQVHPSPRRTFPTVSRSTSSTPFHPLTNVCPRNSFISLISIPFGPKNNSLVPRTSLFPL